MWYSCKGAFRDWYDEQFYRRQMWQESLQFVLSALHWCLGGTPLVDAIRHGHREVQKILYKAGGNLGNADVAQMLCTAAANNDLTAIQASLIMHKDTD